MSLNKELPTVHKKSTGSDGSAKIEAASKAYEVALAPPAEGSRLFAGAVAEHSRCYVIVDAMKRHSTVIYSPFKPFQG